MSIPPQIKVTRRRVFYIPGYDPIPPRRYRELYRKEGAVQAAISGYEIALRAGESGPRYGWHVDAVIDGVRVATDIDVLVWSDIVRASMKASILAIYWKMVRTAWIYLSTGTLWRLTGLRKGPVIAALYPVGMLLAQLMLACVLVLVLWVGFRTLGGIALGREAHWPEAQAVIGNVTGLGLGLLGGYALLRWFKRQDGRIYAHYLIQDYAYGAATQGAYAPALERRLADFRGRVAQALRADTDELLIVGHSSGAHVAVSMLADLIRTQKGSGDTPALALLSLGQVVPMISFLPRAHRLRGDLAFPSSSDALTWVDVSAPGDGCSFALCDPVAVTGVSPQGSRWPLVISAAFTQTLSAARMRALRWRFFRLHLQYLCAFDRPGDYDYFQITAGPVTLSERYRDRPASRSRIVAPVNRYTSLAP